MKIVFDTNIFVRTNFDLESPHLQFIFETIDTGLELIMLQIVLDETIQKYREKVEQKAGALNKLIDDLERLGSLSKMQKFKKAKQDKMILSFASQLKKKFADKIQPYPETSNAKIVERLLKKKPPFHGDKGYKDTVIWESLLEMHRTTPAEVIYFITNDKIFFNEESSGLNPQLKEEAATLGLCKHEPVKCFGSFDSFMKEVCEPRYRVFVEEYSKLIKEKGFGPNLKKVITENQLNFINMPQLKGLIPGGFWNIDALIDFNNLNLEKVIPYHKTEKEISKDQFLISFTGNFTLGLSALINPSEVETIRKKHPFCKITSIGSSFSSGFDSQAFGTGELSSEGRSKPKEVLVSAEIKFKLAVSMTWSSKSGDVKFIANGADFRK